MKLKDYDDFLLQVPQGKFLNTTSQWLPDTLLAKAVEDAGKLQEWSLQVSPGRMPRLILKTSDGTTYTGTFVLAGKRVSKVDVAVTKAKKTPPTKTGSNSDPSQDPNVNRANDLLHNFHPPVNGGG